MLKTVDSGLNEDTDSLDDHQDFMELFMEDTQLGRAPGALKLPEGMQVS